MISKNDIEVREYHDTETLTTRYTASLTLVVQGTLSQLDRGREETRQMKMHLVRRLWGQVYGDVIQHVRRIQDMLGRCDLPPEIMEEVGALLDRLSGVREVEEPVEPVDEDACLWGMVGEVLAMTEEVGL